MASGDPEIMHPRCRCDQHRLHWPHGQSTQAPIGEPVGGICCKRAGGRCYEHGGDAYADGMRAGVASAMPEMRRLDTLAATRQLELEDLKASLNGSWSTSWERSRAKVLSALPPCQITDPAALAKLTPSKVRAYLKGKGWETSADWIVDRLIRRGVVSMGSSLGALAFLESRSAAAVYLDILATPEEGEGGYQP